MQNLEFKTDQEKFWAGEFGSEYVKRNRHHLPNKVYFFSKVLARTRGVRSVIEFGANIGLNLFALRSLLPDLEVSAVEVNPAAYSELQNIPGIKAYNQSLLSFEPEREYDLAIYAGVLIHQNPEVLGQAYDVAYKSSRKYILISEYYNPVPVSIPYRGHNDKLFKRDFAGEMLDRFPDLKLVDYGFGYRRDPNFPQDDLNWFLLEK